MKTPLEIEIRCNFTALPEAERIKFRAWLEDAIFSKFGRSPCMSRRMDDGKTTLFNYAVDWEAE